MQIRSIFLIVISSGAGLGSEALKTRIAEFALQAVTITLPTIFIAGFLVVESWHQRKLMGKPQLSTPYMKVVAMLIESYATEAIWTILLAILLALYHPMQQFFTDTQLYIEIIAYLLVLYRVANGRAYGSKRAHGSETQCSNISSLQWDHTTAASLPIGCH
ncbi:hypothetical protein AGABI1DRAFT_132111 [Agaricus bisporus var. burnettii JB137-S8]|uniref:Uncharacterized protein n=1 Tax=Agaricus bisporus var. burnettii (strain JB137-S8 / ATCC MYA-4627 / FGSC 10392) TaxID=597362 RepID=K5WYC5_AGABU|nr:uncharacterized protein AGABI1DRAFT_132111 [Agaricus bisporus var. burnettii JB137-S8]EKM75572.1 hypothetical protein AGABI1DRAFT_132111 [Agaricus bisporus var. burnettii JB137-S8]